MSHFSLTVIHDNNADIDEILAPYYEGNIVAPYIIYTRDGAIKEYRQDHLNTEISDNECWENMADGYITDKNGNIYSKYNPMSKWDWYTIGGRWDKHLLLKTGEKVNSAQIKDVDFENTKPTYAVITPNGLWHEAGRMLWWGLSTASEKDAKNWYDNYSEFLASEDQNLFITIVDCHI